MAFWKHYSFNRQRCIIEDMHYLYPVEFGQFPQSFMYNLWQSLLHPDCLLQSVQDFRNNILFSDSSGWICIYLWDCIFNQEIKSLEMLFIPSPWVLTMIFSEVSWEAKRLVVLGGIRCTCHWRYLTIDPEHQPIKSSPGADSANIASCTRTKHAPIQMWFVIVWNKYNFDSSCFQLSMYKIGPIRYIWVPNWRLTVLLHCLDWEE